MFIKWFTKEWWKFLLGPRDKYYHTGIIRTAICRARNHQCGVWYYNLNGLEPDMHCKNCNDYLG